MYPLADGLFAPKNQWYVAAWSTDVTRDPIQRMILNEPVALYRKEDGSPVAVHGRCPHRSYPLGKSRVVGDNIECGYHGITFRPDGSCVSIPSQDNVPSVCRIAAYPLVERWKWIWIWMGDPALADETLIPDHFEGKMTDPSFKTVGGVYNFANARYALLHDNLLDLTHIGYLHRDTFGDGAGADEVPKAGTDARWVESRFDQPDLVCPPVFQYFLGYKGRVSRKFGLRFYSPCLHIGKEEFVVGPTEPDAGRPLGVMMVYHAITPASTTSSHYFWGAAYNWEHPDPQFSEGLAAGAQAPLVEDINASEQIEQMIVNAGGRLSEILLRADNVCVLGRRLIEKQIRAEQPTEALDAAE